MAGGMHPVVYVRYVVTFVECYNGCKASEV